MKCIIALLLAAPALAFMPPTPAPQRAQVVMSASRDWKKDIAKAAFVALPMLAPLVAGAKIDYEGTFLLGKVETIDRRSNRRVRSTCLFGLLV